MTDNKKTNIGQFIEQAEVSAQLTEILGATDKAVLQKMIQQLASIAASRVAVDSPDELLLQVNTHVLAVYIDSYRAVTGSLPEASLLEGLNP